MARAWGRAPRLSFATGEECGTVSARQNAGLYGDGANLVERAAIGTATLLEHLIAEDALLESFKAVGGGLLGFLGPGFRHAFAQGGGERLAFQLLVLFGVQSVAQLVADFLFDLRVQFFVKLGRRELALRLAGQFHELADGSGDFPAAIVPELDGGEHIGFGGLLRTGFHHDDAVFGAGHDDIELAVAAFAIGGIGDALPVFKTYADAAEHVREWNIGDGQRRRRAGDGQRIGVLLGIGREHHGDNLGFIEEALGEERPDRPVDQAAGKNLFFRGTSLAFDEATGDFAGGVSVLPIVDGEREKARARFGLFGHARGNEDRRVTGANDDRAVRLFGHFSGLEGNFATV